MITKLKIILISLISMILIVPAFSSEDKKILPKFEFEKKLQFGFGFEANSLNLLDLAESLDNSHAIRNGFDYSYSHYSDEENENITSLSKSRQNAVLAEYVLSGMEYGIHFRLLWRILMFETNILILPVNYYNNSSIELSQDFLIGIRSPFFIMPYLVAGPVLTLAFNNYGFYKNVEEDGYVKSLRQNSNINLGFNIKTGLDLKFKNFSIGTYYLYNLDKIQEAGFIYNEYRIGNLSDQDLKRIFLTQSRFGVSISWYMHKPEKKENNESADD